MNIHDSDLSSLEQQLRREADALLPALQAPVPVETLLSRARARARRRWATPLMAAAALLLATLLIYRPWSQQETAVDPNMAPPSPSEPMAQRPQDAAAPLPRLAQQDVPILLTKELEKPYWFVPVVRKRMVDNPPSPVLVVLPHAPQPVEWNQLSAAQKTAIRRMLQQHGQQTPTTDTVF